MDPVVKSHTDLHDAMRRVRLKVGKLPKDSRNPHFNNRFTSLEMLTERVLPVLDSEGLAWDTLPGVIDGMPVLHYELTHDASNQCAKGQMPLFMAKSDPQGYGSALTYARRYALTTVLNLISDEDDDGHAGTAGADRSLTQLAYGKTPVQIGEAFTAVGLQVPNDPVRALADVPDQWRQPLRDALLAV